MNKKSEKTKRQGVKKVKGKWQKCRRKNFADSQFAILTFR